MPISDLIKDPETGKIKPVVLIAGAGVGIAGIFMFMSKGNSNTGTTSTGQSSDISGALGSLQDAVNGLAGQTSGSESHTVPGGAGGVPGGTSTPGTTRTISGADVPPTMVQSQPNVVKLGAPANIEQTTAHAVGSIPVVTAIGKASNSGISPAPSVVRQGGAVIVSNGGWLSAAGQIAHARLPGTATRTPNTSTFQRNQGAIEVPFGGWGSAANQLAHSHVPAKTPVKTKVASFGGWGSAANQVKHKHAPAKTIAKPTATTKTLAQMTPTEKHAAY